jgi:hypothetical protein
MAHHERTAFVPLSGWWPAGGRGHRCRYLVQRGQRPTEEQGDDRSRPDRLSARCFSLAEARSRAVAEALVHDPGSAARRCVQVKNRTSVRSNSFIVGNFRNYIRFWDGTMENSKLAYTPLYPEQTAPPLTVSADPLDGQPAVPPLVERGTDDYAWAMNGMPFYATGTLLAHRGRWRFVATAGRNWGCFDLTL